MKHGDAADGIRAALARYGRARADELAARIPAYLVTRGDSGDISVQRELSWELEQEEAAKRLGDLWDRLAQECGLPERTKDTLTATDLERAAWEMTKMRIITGCAPVVMPAAGEGWPEYEPPELCPICEKRFRVPGIGICDRCLIFGRNV